MRAAPEPNSLDLGGVVDQHSVKAVARLVTEVFQSTPKTESKVRLNVQIYVSFTDRCPTQEAGKIASIESFFMIQETRNNFDLENLLRAS